MRRGQGVENRARARWGRVVPAGRLIGYAIRDTQGDEIGKLEEIMIDVGSGCISYAVLSVRDTPGSRPSLLAVPWEALTPEVDREALSLDQRRSELVQPPLFELNRQSTGPGTADREREDDLDYGYDPYWDV